MAISKHVMILLSVLTLFFTFGIYVTIENKNIALRQKIDKYYSGRTGENVESR